MKLRGQRGDCLFSLAARRLNLSCPDRQGTHAYLFHPHGGASGLRLLQLCGCLRFGFLRRTLSLCQVYAARPAAQEAGEHEQGKAHYGAASVHPGSGDDAGGPYPAYDPMTPPESPHDLAASLGMLTCVYPFIALVLACVALFHAAYLSPLVYTGNVRSTRCRSCREALGHVVTVTEDRRLGAHCPV